MKHYTNINSLVQEFLPEGAGLVAPLNPEGSGPIQVADLDDDDMNEILVIYQSQGVIKAMVLKYFCSGWVKLGELEFNGHTADYIGFADITGDGRELLIGEQVGAAWNKLHIYSVTARGLVKIAESLYSRMELEDMPGEKGIDGKDELALWRYVSDDAYTIDVLKWNGNELAPAEDTYRYYFKRVVSYYCQVASEDPASAFNWYYLADAQLKAGLDNDALKSIDRGIALNSEYPTRKEFESLKAKAKVSSQLAKW